MIQFMNFNALGFSFYNLNFEMVKIVKYAISVCGTL